MKWTGLLQKGVLLQCCRRPCRGAHHLARPAGGCRAHGCHGGSPSLPAPPRGLRTAPPCCGLRIGPMLARVYRVGGRLSREAGYKRRCGPGWNQGQQGGRPGETWGAVGPAASQCCCAAGAVGAPAAALPLAASCEHFVPLPSNCWRHSAQSCCGSPSFPPPLPLPYFPPA
eukprot:1159522-Pelagomonas_calceolata.AAC.2